MKVLFICKGNVARSQMAEGFFNSMTSKHKAFSAGVKPGLHEGKTLDEEEDSRRVVKAMKEKGIDLSGKRSKKLTKKMFDKADLVVSMCGIDTRYASNSRKIKHWRVKNPRFMNPVKIAEVRDKIQKKVKILVGDLNSKQALFKKRVE
ncbi:MAG: low molecular weight phosphatase family protein [Candidatus Marsarchaeota archaeon]|nr:low molecular weight phosphatase family protein [Candidatus Marsarchaeota archaeon]